MAGISDVWLGLPLAEHWPDDLTIKGRKNDESQQTNSPTWGVKAIHKHIKKGNDLQALERIPKLLVVKR